MKTLTAFPSKVVVVATFAEYTGYVYAAFHKGV